MELTDKTKDELINMAADMGLELTGTERIDTLRRLLQEKGGVAAPIAAGEQFTGNPADHRHTGGVSEPVVSARTDNGFGPKLSGKRVTVIIARTEDTGDAVFLGHNGVGYRVKTDTPVELPIEVVNASLRDARKTIYQPVGNSMISSDVQTYPYQIVQ